MKKSIQWLLAKLFPMRRYKIRTPEEVGEWFRYEASNYSHMDPFRPLGSRDSWAGNKQGAYDGIAWG